MIAEKDSAPGFKEVLRSSFACFVDFKKTFDSVFLDELLYKLLQFNVGGCFCNSIKSLYLSSTCSIKIGKNRNDPFNTREVYVKVVF